MTRYVIVRPFHSGWEAGKLYWQQCKRWGANKRKAKVYGERGASVAYSRLRHSFLLDDLRVESLKKGEYIRRYL